jgi:hypothetical protein
LRKDAGEIFFMRNLHLFELCHFLFLEKKKVTKENSSDFELALPVVRSVL